MKHMNTIRSLAEDKHAERVHAKLGEPKEGEDRKQTTSRKGIVIARPRLARVDTEETQTNGLRRGHEAERVHARPEERHRVEPGSALPTPESVRREH